MGPCSSFGCAKDRLRVDCSPGWADSSFIIVAEGRGRKE